MGRHQRISSMAEKGRALARRKLAGKLFAFLLTFILFGLGIVTGVGFSVAYFVWRGCRL